MTGPRSQPGAGLGTMMTGGHAAGDTRERPPGKFYRTPVDATEALYRWLRRELVWDPDCPIWEPACGAGDIAEHLSAQGHVVHASDLYDHGYGDTGVDFLTADWPGEPCPIITNPPYGDGHEEAFIRHAVQDLHAPLLCLLLKGRSGTPVRRATPCGASVNRRPS